MINYLTS